MNMNISTTTKRRVQIVSAAVLVTIIAMTIWDVAKLVYAGLPAVAAEGHYGSQAAAIMAAADMGLLQHGLGPIVAIYWFASLDRSTTVYYRTAASLIIGGLTAGAIGVIESIRRELWQQALAAADPEMATGPFLDSVVAVFIGGPVSGAAVFVVAFAPWLAVFFISVHALEQRTLRSSTGTNLEDTR